MGKMGTDAEKPVYRIEHKDGLGLREDLTVPLVLAKVR
jgi:hypothetical protein